MTQKTEIEINAEYSPTFREGDVVILKKNCYSYSYVAEFDSMFFKEKQACLVRECGLSHFFINKNNEFVRHVDNCEWCTVEVIVENPQEDLNDENDVISGVIRVKDLRVMDESDLT